jgi:hypothetical protein
MKLSDIITDYTEKTLYHPIVGIVDWKYSSSECCYVLMFHTGLDKNKPLIVDDTILLDDDWVHLDCEDYSL